MIKRSMRRTGRRFSNSKGGLIEKRATHVLLRSKDQRAGGSAAPWRALRGGLWTSLAALRAVWRLVHKLTAAPRQYRLHNWKIRCNAKTLCHTCSHAVEFPIRLELIKNVP